jgi:hypothetical protein
MVAALCLAWAAVVLRSLVFLVYEHAFFDSDRAIIGLMAKHLAEGRAFPLLFYGQSYMLGIEAWFAAPFFLVAGASVASLHFSQVVLNLITVTMMLVGLVRAGGLHAMQAAAATTFLTFAPPLTASALIEEGSNIPPFLFVALLWIVRTRPLWFGFLLAIGFLTREFTIYAAPVLLTGELVAGRLFQREVIGRWIVAAVVALATWQGVQTLKPYADLAGPGTRGELLNGLGGSQVGNLGERMRLEVADLPARAAGMFFRHVPRLVGAQHVDHPIARQGRDWMFYPLVLLIVPGVALAGAHAWRQHFQVPPYGWYLLGVGLLSAIGCILTRPDEAVQDRYILLALLLPVGAVAVSLAARPARIFQLCAVAVVALWSLLSAADHLTHARRYASGSEPNELRSLIDGLVERGITVAEAPYWRAYKITFMADERVVVASTDFVRIQTYRRLANQAGDTLARLQEVPCRAEEATDRIGRWYVCRRQLPAG